MAAPSLFAISIVDLLAAVLLFWPFLGTFMLLVALMMLAKGIWSVTSSASAGFYWDIFGAVDFVAAIVMIIVNFGTPVGFAWVFGSIVGAKAVYALLSSI